MSDSSSEDRKEATKPTGDKGADTAGSADNADSNPDGHVIKHGTLRGSPERQNSFVAFSTGFVRVCRCCARRGAGGRCLSRRRNDEQGTVGLVYEDHAKKKKKGN
jgi:hypothetical protein